MKDVDHLMESIGESTVYVQRYIEQKIELTKLEAAEKSAVLISEVITIVALVMIGSVFLLLFTVTLGLYLAQWLASYPQAFLIMTVLYALLGLLFWAFRRSIVTDRVVGIIVARFFKKSTPENQRSEANTQ